MGQNLSRFGNGTKTNFLEEFEIFLEKIAQCEYYKLNSNHEYDIYPLDVTDVKNTLLQMKDCYYVNTNYVYNNKHRIKIMYNDGTDIMLALSDSEQYIGRPTRASGMGIWFFLKNDDGSKFTPFKDLFNENHVDVKEPD